MKMQILTFFVVIILAVDVSDGCGRKRRNNGMAELSETMRRHGEQLSSQMQISFASLSNEVNKVMHSTVHLGERLEKAVDNLRIDLNHTLSGLQRQMDVATTYLTKHLGPVIEKTLKDIDRNIEILVKEVSLTLRKANIAIDKVIHCLDLITVIILVAIGTFCTIILNNIHLGIWVVVFVFIQTMSFVCAPVLLIAYVYRLCTGIDPTPQDMVKYITAVIMLIPIAFVLRVLLPIICFILYVPFAVLYGLTIGPFQWTKNATWKWNNAWVLFLSTGITAFLIVLWLIGFYCFDDNIAKASLLTYCMWWIPTASVRVLGPRPPRPCDIFREKVRQKRLGYYKE
ncbi:uncharacterized protein [Amphiura filiformis]|uniref:uncharacterized protein n=1 Tax=Amphiura filiformis TaxID=82378 RepID=UPI003B215C12